MINRTKKRYVYKKMSKLFQKWIMKGNAHYFYFPLYELVHYKDENITLSVDRGRLRCPILP